MGSPLDRMTLWRIVFLWAACFIGTAGLFAINYGMLPRYKENYTAILYPGDQLAAEMSRRFRTLTGRPLAYLIGPMWEGGNVAHYASEHPRVLIDASPLRTPWIDLVAAEEALGEAIVVVVPRGRAEGRRAEGRRAEARRTEGGAHHA